MVTEKTEISLWKNSFSVSKWKNQEKINELLGVIMSMEGIIKKYLQKTEIDFPNLTDHSINHAHILWEYADIIVGNTGMVLNPVEGFILNSVFLLHDAGMCYSILNNKDEISNDTSYTDYIANNDSNLSHEELELEALFYTVRQNHGEYAIRIAIELLNEEEFFIADVNYRQEFGDIIGKIAKSHTCNINYIEREFGQSYSSPRFPKQWNIDYKKISFILRTADAANLDNLRTPKTLKMIDELKGESKEHWTFQKKLGFPNLESDGLLVYSTNSSFKKNEQKAWWYCYNALKVLDDELKNANNYFVSVHQISFAAKSVKYINDTLALGVNSIKTLGWDSINTTVRVSNPVHIASELGGEKLYGKVNIAVREIIQNSIDAVHVHRIHTGQDNLAVGKIKVEIEESNGDYFLIIIDNGIGMSQSLMTNELLDFGGSYWKSNKFYSDFKGLKSKGFEAIGKFGIGFFSVFMLGNQITVTSWKYGEDIGSMRTLDFYDGLFSNPVLRYPTQQEKNSIIDRGTAVRVKLKNNPYEKNGLIHSETFDLNTLKNLIQFYIPSADVEIITKEVTGEESIIKPKNVENLDYLELIDYINLKGKRYEGFTNNNTIKTIKQLPVKLIEIMQNGIIMGKLAPLPMDENAIISDMTAIVMSRGIKVRYLPNMIGYINSSEVISIRRDEASKVISYDSLKVWAIKQLEHLGNHKDVGSYEKMINDLTITFNLYDDNFPIVRTKKNNKYKYISIKEFRKYLRNVDEITLKEENRLEKFRGKNLDGFANIYWGFEMKDIIAAQDLEKLSDSSKVIKQILTDEWHEYDNESNTENFSLLSDNPVSYSWIFKRKIVNQQA
ncbi:MAG: ATP-binding protein [Bacteroidota bacterium]